MDALPAVLKQHPQVLAEPAPGVYIRSFDGRGATLQVRPWVDSAAYWSARRALSELVMRYMDEHDIQLWEPRERWEKPV
jgi:small conductance mechanosensitive channel